MIHTSSPALTVLLRYQMVNPRSIMLGVMPRISRNYYSVSHGKLICEYWTLLLNNLTMSRLGRDVNPKAVLLSSPASWRGSFPGELGKEGIMHGRPLSQRRFGDQEESACPSHAGFVSNDVTA